MRIAAECRRRIAQRRQLRHRAPADAAAEPVLPSHHASRRSAQDRQLHAGAAAMKQALHAKKANHEVRRPLRLAPSRASERRLIDGRGSVRAPPGAAPTDITNIPLVTPATASVKPNIMLLLDASGSMGRTHMPDEVETVTKPGSIGYKSPQCNVLYYDPAKTYIVPKQYDGIAIHRRPTSTTPPTRVSAASTAPWPIPSRRRSGDAVRRLGRQHPRHRSRLRPKPAGAAYYYLYTGPETLIVRGPPCTQARHPRPGRDAWRRHLDPATTSAPQSAAQQTNFAIWYSFYRTRLALVKSAASLAFAPLERQQARRLHHRPAEGHAQRRAPSIPTAICSSATSITRKSRPGTRRCSRRRPFGASPAREGLARVGRY